MARFLYAQAENILSKLPGKDRREKSPIYLSSMEYTMLTLKAILFDAEEKQEDDPHLRNWLKELQNVFYQIEDAMDEFKFKREDSPREGSKKEEVGKTLVRAPHFLGSDSVAYKSQPARKMGKLCDQLDTIAAKLYEFHLTERNNKQLARTRMEITHSFRSATKFSARLMKPTWRSFYPLIGTSVIYPQRRYNEIQEIFRRSNNFFHIVGNAGTGKSTLAKFLNNDSEVAQTFPLRIWVSVNEDFDTRRLIKEILSFAIGENARDDLTEKQLLFKVEQILRGKAWLIIFQDLSIENLDNHTMFGKLVGMANQGSKIIVTTQNEAIANAIGHPTIYKIDELLPDDSFSLFKEYAFRDGQDVQNPELRKIANQIVEKCKGVPLAIKCLGSLLSSKTKIAEWENVRDHKIWAQEGKGGSISPALRLCYNLMPSHLKLCFLYCSQLPNDRMVSSNDLIQLWMAHGLLHSPEEKSLSLENIGEKYFKELWSRCFFHDIAEYGLGYWFKMHPLIRKLACIVAQEQVECSVGTKPITEIRSIAFPVREMVPVNDSLAHKCISRFKCLRLLYLGNTNLQEIPNAIGTLNYLRYLDLQGNKRIKRLPNSICDLQNLQTLILASCSELEELPNNVRNLISLRYLWVTTNQLRLQKNGIGILSSLRFLAIGGCEGDSLQNLFDKVQCLAALETLMIYDCKTLKSLPNGIRFLKSLQNLVIWGCKKIVLTLENVEFTLQRFTIRDLPKVDELPGWLRGSAQTLRILDTTNCPIVVDIKKLRETYEAIERVGIQGVVRLPLPAGGTCLNYVNAYGDMPLA